MAIGGSGFTGHLPERMQICKMLWDVGIKADFSWKVKAKFQAQFKAAETAGAPYGIILGEDELKEGKVKIKEMGLPEGHPEKDGVVIERANLIEEVRSRLQARQTGSGLEKATNGLSINGS